MDTKRKRSEWYIMFPYGSTVIRSFKLLYSWSVAAAVDDWKSEWERRTGCGREDYNHDDVDDENEAQEEAVLDAWVSQCLCSLHPMIASLHFMLSQKISVSHCPQSLLSSEVEPAFCYYLHIFHAQIFTLNSSSILLLLSKVIHLLLVFGNFVFPGVNHWRIVADHRHFEEWQEV